MITEEQAKELAAPHQKHALYLALFKAVRDEFDWKLIAISSLLLNIWLARVAGVL